MGIADNIKKIKNELPPMIDLVAVSKYKPLQDLMEAYNCGQRLFGENRPQEMMQKAQNMPYDVQWHFIGHLQSNKIKMVVPYATLIHSVDTERLLYEIDRYCLLNGFDANILLELHIASEETKQGFKKGELMELFDRMENESSLVPKKVIIRGLMSMATFTDDEDIIRKEFGFFNQVFDEISQKHYPFLSQFNQKSFGMSNDYHIAIEMGSTLVRIGTNIFGARDLHTSISVSNT